MEGMERLKLGEEYRKGGTGKGVEGMERLKVGG
jgi:hypothetical protein